MEETTGAQGDAGARAAAPGAQGGLHAALEAPEAPPSSEDAKGDDAFEGEEEEEEEEDELAQAARAGIRLLEENAQLHEELRHLQEQHARAEAESTELRRLVAEKEVHEAQLADHLRECIRENQGLLTELSQSKDQVAELQQQLQEHKQQLQQAASRSSRSPGKRRGNRSPRQATQPPSLQPQVDTSCESCTEDKTPLVLAPVAALNGSNASKQDVAVSAEQGEDTTSTSNRSNAQSLLREDTEALKEAEAKVEEARRRSSVLGRELASANKQISELRALQGQLHEARLELHMLQSKAEEQTRELDACAEEREEERALIQSLRHTIEIYQTLDDPRVAKLDDKHSPNGTASPGDDEPVVPRRKSPRRASERQRRRSDGCMAPSQALAASQGLSVATAVGDDRFNLRDENERLLAELDHLGQQVLNLKLLEGFSRVVRSPRNIAGVTAPPMDSGKGVDVVAPVGYGTSSRLRFLEQQVAVLQDLLHRFRVQWKREFASRHAVEQERAELLSRMDKLHQLRTRQCAACDKEREELSMAQADDSAWDDAAAVYETLLRQVSNCVGKEEEAEAEQLCFAILRRLVDSWTTDKAKRMCLHDWLTNAIRGTGKRRPLYLYELSGEIASGFQVLLVPILRERFGVHVQVEKRLRNVIVTDLKLEVSGADAAKAKACLQRISRSLLWLIDVESALANDDAWVGDFARRKAAKMCVNI